MRAVVVSGGTPPSKELLKSYLSEDDFVIGVDMGCNALCDYDMKADLILGDFDSAKEESIKFLVGKGAKILAYDVEKDYTDTHLGYIKAVENGADEILLFGVTGTRLDHALGNLGLFLNAKRDGVRLEIIDDHNRMFMIDKESTFKGNRGETISFHALSDVVKNVNIKGGKYDLIDYDLNLLEPRAICNEFLDEDITISFDKGNILVIFPKD